MKSRLSVSFIVLLGLAMTQAVPTPEPATKVLEKKSLIPEETNKTEILEAPAIEDAEEPIQAERTKKSATTTFCVEIRPGPSDGPVKVCDEPSQPLSPPPEPQIPQVPHEIHDPPPPPPPQHQDSEFPFVIVPPNPFAVFLPGETPCHPEIQHPFHASIINYPIIHQPQIPLIQPSHPQHLIISSGGSWGPSAPCPPSPYVISGDSGNHPQTVIALLRSAMSPIENIPGINPMEPGMAMRNSEGEIPNPHGGSIITVPSNGGNIAIMPDDKMTLGPDVVGRHSGSFGRNHGKKLISVPIPTYHQSSGGGAPYVVQCNPQILSLGTGGSTVLLSSGRDASEGLGAPGEGGPGGSPMEAFTHQGRPNHMIIPPTTNGMQSLGTGGPTVFIAPGTDPSQRMGAPGEGIGGPRASPMEAMDMENYFRQGKTHHVIIPPMYQPNYQTHSMSPYPYGGYSSPGYSTYFRHPGGAASQPKIGQRTSIPTYPIQNNERHNEHPMVETFPRANNERQNEYPTIETFSRGNNERQYEPGFRVYIPPAGQTSMIDKFRHGDGAKHAGPCGDSSSHDEIAKRETAETTTESEEKV